MCDIKSLAKSVNPLMEYLALYSSLKKQFKKFFSLQEKFNDQKDILLLDPCIKKYLFDRDVPEFNFFSEVLTVEQSLLKSKHDQNIIIIDDQCDTVNILQDLQKIQDEISDTYLNYFEHRQILYQMYKQVNESALTSKRPSNILWISSGEKKIIDQLNKLRKKYQLYYFYKHKWPFCCNQQKLEYDFYCIVVHDNKLIQFAIEYDGVLHFEPIFGQDSYEMHHKRDIIKQYYLFQMRVHLIRFNTNKSDFNLLDKFIFKLIGTTTYVRVNSIKFDQRIQPDNKVHSGLSFFYTFFKKQSDALGHINVSDDDISDDDNNISDSNDVPDDTDVSNKYTGFHFTKKDFDKFLKNRQLLRIDDSPHNEQEYQKNIEKKKKTKKCIHNLLKNLKQSAHV